MGTDSSPLTVACVWVAGEFPYSIDYVRRLRSMVARWIDRPFRFVCLTDRPELATVEGVEPIAVEKLAGFAPWTKLQLFNPARGFTGRVLYLDLDSLVIAPLAPIIDFPAPFVVTADPASMHRPRRLDSFGRAIVRKVNSSVMVWDAGTHASLYDKWSPPVAQRLSSDQDWIGEQLPRAAEMPRAWFPRISELSIPNSVAVAPILPADAKVVLVKVPKNVEAAEKWPWFDEAWR